MFSFPLLFLILSDHEKAADEMFQTLVGQMEVNEEERM